MQPIFNEQIKMWSDLGYPLPIEEGTYSDVSLFFL